MRLFIYGTLLDGLSHGEAARLVEGLAGRVTVGCVL